MILHCCKPCGIIIYYVLYNVRLGFLNHKNVYLYFHLYNFIVEYNKEFCLGIIPQLHYFAGKYANFFSIEIST